MPKSRRPAVFDELVRRYAAGESPAALARSAGVTPATMRRWLLAFGAPLRTRGQAESAKWKGRDRAAVEKLCGAAWAARRGQKDGLKTKIARARTTLARLRGLARAARQPSSDLLR